MPNPVESKNVLDAGFQRAVRSLLWAYVGHGEYIEVDVMRSRWGRVRKKKRKTLQFVGSGTAAPSPQITKLTAKRVRGMGMF